jgi:hypothetical protein
LKVRRSTEKTITCRSFGVSSTTHASAAGRYACAVIPAPAATAAPAHRFGTCTSDAVSTAVPAIEPTMTQRYPTRSAAAPPTADPEIRPIISAVSTTPLSHAVKPLSVRNSTRKALRNAARLLIRLPRTRIRTVPFMSRSVAMTVGCPPASAVPALPAALPSSGPLMAPCPGGCPRT